MIPEEKLKEWERLAAEATPGPWEAVDEEPWVALYVANKGEDADGVWLADFSRYRNNANAKFCAASREAIPALIEEVRRLRERAVELSDERSQIARQREAAIKDFWEVRDDRDALRAQLDRIREAAEPITNIWIEEIAADNEPWADCTGVRNITVGQIRALADAIKGEA